ncbi:MAG TPA: DUF4230 domain-containing protein [Candidatus Acidoferrales bacterium]|nr:DUF4230 domain-containing protein [Candidatus Acidoferrales bacterium]
MPVIEQTTPATPPANKSFSLVKGILAGSLLTIAFIGATVWLSTGVGLLHLMGFMRNGAMRINVDQPTVVRQIQQLQKLETVSYTMDKIIGGARDNSYLPRFLAGDRILLVVHGEVVAGVNLANIKGTDVSVQGHNISLRLPTAEVFSTRIDNAKSRVYSRDTGLFSSPDPNLESEVREEAERQLQQSAVVDGILKSADQNARNTVTGMLTGLGFTQVALQ